MGWAIGFNLHEGRSSGVSGQQKQARAGEHTALKRLGCTTATCQTA
jgi:hypothetical protein